MSTNYQVKDLPKTLSYEINDDIDMRRVRLGLHRLGFKAKNGEITRGQYMKLQDYFYERRTIDILKAYDMIVVIGRDKVYELIGKDFKWIAELRKGKVYMNMRQYTVLSEYVRERGALGRQ